MSDNVVVTGIGIYSSFGSGVDKNWQKVINKENEAKRIPHSRFDPEEHNFRGKIACINDEYNPSDYDVVDERRHGVFHQYGLIATEEAIDDAGLNPDSDSWDPTRVGTSVGSCNGGMHEIESQPEGRPGIYFSINYLHNLAAGHISIEFNAEGPNHAPSTACAAGNHAIDIARKAIESGDADVMIAGGAENGVTRLGIGAFDSLRAYTTRNDAPKEASRPFDADRDGLLIGNGSGILIMESEEHAKERGADIYATVESTGRTADAYHPSRPNQNGIHRAMKQTMERSSTDVEEIDYVSAHATSTPEGDKNEAQAINNYLGENTPVSALKSAFGHTLGAAGGIEAVFSVMSIQENIVPPTQNQESKDPECPVDVIDEPVDMEINKILSNTAGFGGTNGCVLFSSYDG